MNNKYKALSKQVHERGDYQLCPLRYDDIFLIKQWRNEQLDILRQQGQLTDEDQEYYYQNVIRPLFDQTTPKQLLFSYLYKGELMGYGGLVYVNWEDQRAEVSFLVNTVYTKEKAAYTRLFSNYLELIKEVAFKTAGLNRIFTETYNIRDWHIAILEQVGFVLEGNMKEHVFIQGEFVDSLLHGYLKKYYNAKR